MRDDYEQCAIKNGGVYTTRQDWIDQTLVPYLTATGQAGEVERTLGDEGLQVLAESALALSEGRGGRSLSRPSLRRRGTGAHQGV